MPHHLKTFKTNIMKKMRFLLLLLTVVTLFVSCEKEPVDTPNDATAPQLPPEESFIMPFTGFENADTTGFKGKDSFEEKSGPSYGNWFIAASNVVVWNTVIGLSTAVPVASFREAFNHQPTYAGQGVFVWAYDFKVAGKTYIAKLSGQFIDNNENIKWEMKISQVGGFTDVVWYTGIVSENLKQASWTLNYNADNPQTFIGIDYELDATGKVFTLRYTNIIPGSPDKGDYIEYRVLPGQDFNRNYDVYRIQEDNLLEIEWNVPSSEGHVRNPAHFMDTDWHCWNAFKMDVDCQ